MSYCKYHPLQAASYYCDHCHIPCCDQCINDESPRKSSRCFRCDNELRFLGAIHTAIPFWRRLKETLQYPLNQESLILIIGVAFLSVILGSSLFLLLAYLAVCGAFFKYCFTCLERTAHGDFTPPDMTEAYGSGLDLIGKLIILAFVIGLSITGAAIYIGPTAAMLVATFLVISLPAIFINFALNNSLADALNPLKAIWLISAIGLPYGLFLALITIMISSVAVINEILSSSPSFISVILQSVVANYYTVVIFHMMGYIIFQYQDAFGITAEENAKQRQLGRSEAERNISKMDIALKEGYYDQYFTILSGLIKSQPNNTELLQKAFDFLFATKQLGEHLDIISLHLAQLKLSQREDLLTIYFKKALSLAPKYTPEDPDLRYHLAKLFFQKEDYTISAKLINGLHKSNPGYFKLVEAYTLLYKSLEQLPNMKEKVIVCHKIIANLEKAKTT